LEPHAAGRTVRDASSGMRCARPTDTQEQEGTMNKLRLDLEHLAVDSFATGDGMSSAGTVRGHGYYDTRPSACAYPTPSCALTQTNGEASCQCLYPRTDPCASAATPTSGAPPRSRAACATTLSFPVDRAAPCEVERVHAEGAAPTRARPLFHRRTNLSRKLRRIDELAREVAYAGERVEVAIGGEKRRVLGVRGGRDPAPFSGW